MAFSPNVVLVYVEGNDRQPTGIVDEYQYQYKVQGTDRQLYERRRPMTPLLRLLYRSQAWLWLRKQTLRLPSELPSAQELGPMRSTGGVRVPPEDRREAFVRMKALCEGVCELVVLQPTWQGRQPDDSLRELARELDLRWIDLGAARQDSGVQDFFIDGIHPTPAGHQVFADAIVQVL